jgi:CBS-domain-containing membrane protein
MSRWQVGDVMTTDVATVSEETPFREIVALLEERRVGAVPVVDGGNLVVGVVSEADLLPKMEFAGRPRQSRLFESRRIRAARERSSGDLARDLMSAPAVTVMKRMSVADAARRMDESGVKHLPVVNLAGRLIGIVARGDLLRVFLQTDAELRGDVLDELRQLPDATAARVDVKVDNGVVTLTGQLDRRSAVPGVLRVAEVVDGVVDVVNQLTYQHDDVELPVVNIS